MSYTSKNDGTLDNYYAYIKTKDQRELQRQPPTPILDDVIPVSAFLNPHVPNG